MVSTSGPANFCASVPWSSIMIVASCAVVLCKADELGGKGR